MITPKLRKLIEPNLKMHIPRESWVDIEDMFSEVYLINENGQNIICLRPIMSGDGGLDISLMFLELTGSYYDTGQWSYIKRTGTVI